MDYLTDFYRRLLAVHPDIGAIAAIQAGYAAYGRTYGSPSIADHREALEAARTARED